jgi:hypothetical protein
MNRRDFLSFKTVREPEPTIDLECHALYMRWVDASSAETSAAHDVNDPMAGEPPAQHDRPTTEAIIQQLETRLSTVKRLRVLDAEWLQTTGLGDRVSEILAAFRARGGTVVFDSTEAY